MRVDAFDFDLPEERIALRPSSIREEAKLLCVDGSELTDLQIKDLPDLFEPGDLLVINNTKVIPAFLKGLRPPRDEGGGTKPVSIDLTLHQRSGADAWRAFAKPAKRLKVGDDLTLSEALSCKVEEKSPEGEVLLRFNKASGDLDSAIAEAGLMPLPPYIASKREIDEQDLSDYQTVYAKHKGAVAAPTAGLHFTNEAFQALRDKGVQITEVTLHVGAGTFLPVKAEDTADHKMHSEWGEVSPETADLINQTHEKGGRVIALGTTSLRLIESAADEQGIMHPFAAETDIFITPGYQFRAVDVLMTNFHLPKSTLFMLVSAFAGLENMQAAYAHAIQQEYRFYSYGDACLLQRHDKDKKS